jgi:LuxR family maltose regulon positive regulatory protein
MLDETTARIITLVAPAGYGKTTLAREWLSQGGRRYAWYQADASSRDIAAFALGVRDAIREIVPNAGEAMEAYLRASGSPEDDAHRVATVLADDLEGWPTNAWLAIDDYQLAARSEACELFVDTLSSTGIGLFLVSRKRPAWVTPRRKLYGEIIEFDSGALSLTADEAAAVLSDYPSREASRFTDTAKGWPAIIGLAALTPADSMGELSGLPADLYDYLAEELYKAAPPAVRHAVSLLAIAPTVSRSLSQQLLGEDDNALIREAATAGFIFPQDDAVTMHPLIRGFLRQRLETHGVDRNALIRRVADALLTLDHWDDAFVVISELRANDLLDGLIERSLDPLLDQNRLSTIDHWAGWARSVGYSSPMLQIAEAETDVRKGLYVRAEATARDALVALTSRQRFYARAHLVIARATSFQNKITEPYDHASEAYTCATDPRTRSDAAWARLGAAFELERDDLEHVLNDVTEAPRDASVQAVRILNGRVMLRSLSGSLTDALVPANQVIELASAVDDPLARTSFYNRQASALYVAGWYDEAGAVIDAEVEYARRARLDFVRPFALVIRGAVEWGQGRFDAAEATLSEAVHAAPGDAYVKTHAAHVRGRLLLARGEFDAAAAVTGERPATPPAASYYGEYLAVHAMALACLGQHDRALSLAARVERLTKLQEVRCLAYAARTLVAFRREEQGAAVAMLSFAEEFGCFDAFVTAYRSEQRLLTELVAAQMQDRVRPILSRAHDERLLETARSIPAVDELGNLTARQLEVVELLAAGLSNREIAGKLVLSEVTVKVHLRHIYERLGVRSRTEAAVKAALILAVRRER